MNFAFSHEQEELRATAREFLTDQVPLSLVHEAVDSGDTFNAGLWGRMAGMGWQGVAVPEEYGGAGLGHLELAILAEELGRTLAPVPFSTSVYLAAEALLLAGDEEQKKKYLYGLATGELVGTFAVWERSGTLDLGELTTSVTEGRLTGTKVAVPYGDVADIAVVVARDSKGSDRRIALTVVDLRSQAVTKRRLKSLDVTQSLALLVFDEAKAEPLANSEPATVERLVNRAAVLFAFEQLGGAQRCLEMATAYAKERYQFGRPIGSFQAIKHRLADMLVLVESARSNCYYGAWVVATNSNEDEPLAACLARISATDAYEFASRENLQVHGGIGFTWESDPHLFMRRAKTLEAALGGLGYWREQLVRLLTSASREVDRGL